MGDDRSPAALETAFAARLGVKLGPAERTFIGQAAADWTDDELAGWSADELAGLAFDLWTYGKTCEDPGPQIRIRRLRDGAAPVHVIEIVQLDRPFILASVMG